MSVGSVVICESNHGQSFYSCLARPLPPGPPQRNWSRGKEARIFRIVNKPLLYLTRNLVKMHTVRSSSHCISLLYSSSNEEKLDPLYRFTYNCMLHCKCGYPFFPSGKNFKTRTGGIIAIPRKEKRFSCDEIHCTCARVSGPL